VQSARSTAALFSAIIILAAAATARFGGRHFCSSTQIDSDSDGANGGRTPSSLNEAQMKKQSKTTMPQATNVGGAAGFSRKLANFCADTWR
jgi:hypothetical protein